MDKVYHSVLGDYTDFVNYLLKYYSTLKLENCLLSDRLELLLNTNLSIEKISSLKNLHETLEGNEIIIRKIKNMLLLLEKITNTKISLRI